MACGVADRTHRGPTCCAGANIVAMITGPMIYIALKALLSGILVAAVSEIAKRSPGFGAALTALPLIAILAMIWLWRDESDIETLASYSSATFWFVLPSLPMFLLMPWLLRSGVDFWPSLAIGCALTIGLYFLMILIGPRFGIRL